MRNWEEVDCPNAHECFNGGHWGKGAYDDEESSRAGGKPWGICWCMTEQEHAEAQEELEGAMKANSMAECNFGRDTDLDLDDVAATSPKAKAELEVLRAELAKVNNEFGCETADWPDAWRRVAEVKQEAGKWFRESEELRGENERLKEQLKACATVCTEALVRWRLIGVPQKLRFAEERGMKSLDGVTEWMITTRRNFETMTREFAAMKGKE